MCSSEAPDVSENMEVRALMCLQEDIRRNKADRGISAIEWTALRSSLEDTYMMDHALLSLAQPLGREILWQWGCSLWHHLRHGVSAASYQGSSHPLHRSAFLRREQRYPSLFFFVTFPFPWKPSLGKCCARVLGGGKLCRSTNFLAKSYFLIGYQVYG